MTDTTVLPPRRAGKRRTPRPSDPRRRRVDLRRRRRRVTGRTISADLVLHQLVRDGDVYEVGRRRYLVAPLDQAMLDALIIAAGITEDDEPNGDLEPSLGAQDELESDGLEDERYGGDVALGWQNEGSQEHLTYALGGDETEPELGWTDTGSQLRLAVDDGWGRMNMEGDGDCDQEDNGDMEPSVGAHDDREHDPCDLGEPEELI
jgi:hypothetical protein